MITTREQLEQLEDQQLAPYALRSGLSRGRMHPEPEPAYRTAYQRDRDRILHSAAFRRLEYKTQVFVNDAGDYYRTRLTHTLEVAQIGRTVARALRANEDLVETICLAHDLGHAPFGHAGEDSLNSLLKHDGGFNHNAQSFRVVTLLERRYEDWAGLNLTLETLEGIAKHETKADLSGLMQLDPNTRGSLEAQIANFVDELTYSAHDLDDGLLSGLLVPAQLEELEIWQLLRQKVDWTGTAFDEVMRHRVIRELIGHQVDDVLQITSDELDRLNPQDPQTIQNQPENIVHFSPPLTAMMRKLKAFLYKNMYFHPSVIIMQRKADRIIRGLFQSYMDEPRQLPRLWRPHLEMYGPARTVTDYIASLTDRSAAEEYRRMFDALTRP